MRSLTQWEKIMKFMPEKQNCLIKQIEIMAFAVLIVFSLASASWATTYFVDKNHSGSSDANSGKEDSPWRTIQKGANEAKAGDTVYVKDGIYYEWVDVKNSGVSGKPIIFKAFPGDQPVIDGSGVNVPDWYALFHSSGNDYITLDGFEVRNSGECLIRLRHGNGLVIRNCVAHGNSDVRRSGIVIDHCNRGLVENNEAYDTGWNALTAESTSNVTFQYNYVHDNPEHNGINIFPKTSEEQTHYEGNDIKNNIVFKCTNGIYTRYQVNNVISNNLIFENLANGIILEADQAQPHNFKSYTEIYNNTIADNEGNGIQSSNASYLTVKNNIISGNGPYSVYIAGSVATGHDINHNLYYPSPRFGWSGNTLSSLSSWQDISSQGANSFVGDPVFEDRAGDNYELTAESLHAIDEGVDLSSENVSTDLVGTRRPMGNTFDLGAYEFVTETLPAPKNLRIIE